MRSLTKREVAAMWFFPDKYAAQTKGAIEFYADLPKCDRKLIDDILKKLNGAKP